MQGPDLLLLQARCHDTGNTLLHHAAHLHKEKLAIFLINSLSHSPHRQRFLEAVNNHDGQTALHIATEHLLTSVVAKITSETQLKINLKDKDNTTAFDVITNKCHSSTLKDDWKKPWKISIMLRGACAKPGSKLEEYEDEEDRVKEMTAIESLIMNDRSWNMTTNTILIVATLAITLVFASIFTIPQMLAQGSGGNTLSYDLMIAMLQGTLSHSKSFRSLICSLTLACVLMFCVIANILLTVTSHNEIRAYMLCHSWGCISIMGFSIATAYIIQIYIYMGYHFTYILTACGVIIIAFNIFLSFYFDPDKAFWETVSTLLSMTFLHGFVVTLLLSFLPKKIVNPIIAKLSFIV